MSSESEAPLPTTPAGPATSAGPAGRAGARAAYETVVFDLDGTLVDTIGLIVDSYQHAFRTVLGRQEDERRIRAWIGQPLLRCFQEASPAHADELFAAYTEWNEANTTRLVRGYAGIPELLGELAGAGVRVAVATSKRRPPAARALELTGLTSLVPVLVTMEDTPVHKPDPTPLLFAVDLAGGEPGRAAYVGDAAVDLRAARAAGMAGVGVLWGAGEEADLRAERPSAVCAQVSALRSVLLAERASDLFVTSVPRVTG